MRRSGPREGDNSELSIPFPPRSLEELTALPWTEFETFATDAIRRYYAEYHIEIYATSFSHDDGRDGEGIHVFANADGRRVKENSLAILYRLWLEVKKRSSANVTMDDISKNLVMADNKRVHKLIVVTNRDFARQVKREFDVFVSRRNVSYSLINGKQLLALSHSLQPPGTQAAPVRTSADTATQPAFRIDMSFARQPAPLDLKQVADLTVQPDEPVFLIASVHRTDDGPVADLTLDVIADEPGVDVRPYAHPLGGKVGPGDHVRYVFAVVRAPRRAKLTFRLAASSSAGGPVVAKVRWNGRCVVANRLLTTWIPATRWSRLTDLQERLATWIRDGGRLSFALVAYAGVGKSVMLARLRSTWLGAAVREIYIEGGQRFRDADIAEILFDAAFPVHRERLRADMIDEVEEWLRACGMKEPGVIAEALCNDERVFHNLGTKQLGRLCASLVRRIAGEERAVLVAEDLHFCAPSAIDLLKNMHVALDTFGDANVAFVCTTRQFTAAGDSAVEAEWWAQLQDFFEVTAIPQERLEAFSAAEAEDVLQRTVPTMEPQHARVIVGQVGTTPLALREAIAWFATKGIVKHDAVLDQLVADPDELARAVKSPDLENATASRIKVLKARYPDDLPDLLDGAALVGRFFELEAVRPSHEIDEEAFSACEELDVIRPVEDGLYAFDHDLIRNAVIDLMSRTRQQRLASSLAARAFYADKPYLRGTLLYQAGSFSEAANVLEQAGREAMHRNRYGDATRALLLSLNCLDPARTDRIGPLIDRDPAVVHAKSPRRVPLTVRGRRRVLALLTTLLHSTGATAVFASDAAESFLTEASMLARELEDEPKTVELLVISGTRFFERDELTASIEAHLEAERLLARMQNSAAGARARNLVRVGITQRQQNRTAEALETFRRAHRLADRGDHDFMAYLTMNVGAVFLNDDLHRTARYWQAGLRMAMHSALAHSRIPAMIDVGYLELLRHRDAEAARYLTEAYDLAKRLEFENQTLRAALNLGCLYLIRGHFSRALELLGEAEEIGMRLRIGRRLWRVRANLATAHEANGDIDRAYRHDAWLVEKLGPRTTVFNEGKRQSLPLLNVVLRAKASGAHRRLAATLDRQTRRQIDRILSSALDALGRPPAGAVEGSLRMIGAAPRFIITE